MFEPEGMPSLYPPGPSLVPRRLLARGVDFFVCALPLVFIPWVGPLLASLLVLGIDALPGGTLGKRLFGLKVLSVRHRREVRLVDAILRNLPLASLLFLPYLGLLGIALALLLGLLVGAFELWLMWSEPGGTRVGDILAGTLVLDRDHPSPWRQGEEAHGESGGQAP